MRVALAVAGALALTSACSGRNIHPDLADDSGVLVRQWTLQTQPSTLPPSEWMIDFSSPGFYENTLVFGSQKQGLTSLYPGMMLIRWNLPIPNGVISEITVQGTSVYFGGGDGFLYSVNAENGRVNWRYDLHNPIISKPTVDGGRLFVTTSDDTVFAFDAGSGQWLWHYRRRSSPSATVRGASAPLVDGSEVMAGMSDGFLIGLSLQDGTLKWEKKIHQGSKFTDVDAHPVLKGAILYVSAYDGSLYAMKRDTRDILWRFDAGGGDQVTLDEDRIYLPSSDGHVYALQQDSAKEIWKFELDRGVPTELIVTDRHVAFGSSQQYFYVLDKKTGRGLYRWNAGWSSGFSGAPVYDAQKKKIYVLSHAGNLYSFEFPQSSRTNAVTRPYGFKSFP